MNNSRNFKFDDEKGNNFNITVNHYHMAPQNPMGNLLNVMGQTAMMLSFMNRDNQLEDNNHSMRQLPRNEILIEDNSVPVHYEITDEYVQYELRITSMKDYDNFKYLEVKFEKDFTISEFENKYKDICKSIQYKLCMISDKTNKFIFKFNVINLGEILCAYIENNYFTSMMNKFANGKQNISFKHSICEKLDMPFKEMLGELDYIVDTESVFFIRFEAIDSKYHMKKEGV